MNPYDPASPQDVFSSAVCELLRARNDVLVLDPDKASATGMHKAAEEMPERFLMMGVAQNNMMGVAAGLATMGFMPWIGGFCSSQIRRSMYQLHSLIGPLKLSVKLVAFFGEGPIAGDRFESQDLALMRCVPNMAMIVPADAAEARQAIAAAALWEGPVYIRLASFPAAPLCKEENSFRIGQAVTLREGTDVAMLCTGRQTQRALHAATILETVGISALVMHVPTVQPLDREALLEAASRVRLVATAEEHGIYGGLGESVTEALEGALPSIVKRFGFRRSAAEVAPGENYLEGEGLTAARMAENIHGLLRSA